MTHLKIQKLTGLNLAASGLFVMLSILIGSCADPEHLPQGSQTCYSSDECNDGRRDSHHFPDRIQWSEQGDKYENRTCQVAHLPIDSSNIFFHAFVPTVELFTRLISLYQLFSLQNTCHDRPRRQQPLVYLEIIGAVKP